MIPLRDKDKKVFMVLDIDSDELNSLGQKELDFFKEVCLLIEKIYRKSH